MRDIIKDAEIDKEIETGKQRDRSRKERERKEFDGKQKSGQK